MRAGIKMGNTNLVDTCINDGLTDAFHKYHMGITGVLMYMAMSTLSDTENCFHVKNVSFYIWKMHSAKRHQDV